MRHAKTGFTIIEVTIVAALAAIAAFLAYSPVVNSIIVTQREGTLMSMFSTGDGVLTNLTTLLQPAVIPAIDTSDRSNPLRAIGDAWREVLVAGTDFLPFSMPVPKETGSTVDASGRPVLGVTLPGGTSYRNDIDKNEDYRQPEILRSYLSADGAYTPLATLKPSDFDISSTPPKMSDIKTGKRFASRLTFDKNQNGFAVIRFLPDRRSIDTTSKDTSKNTPAIIKEKDLEFDLDGDGEWDDSFVRGTLAIEYAYNGTSIQTEFPLGRQSILLQVDAGKDYTPIFKLDDTRYVLSVHLLLFDELTQRRTVMATGRKDGRQFIARRFETAIELRNMGRD